MPDTRPGRQLPLPDSFAPRNARRTPGGGARPRARACLIAAEFAVAALAWRDAAATMTPTPSSVSIYPTQTSGFITLNMTFLPPTWGGTSTINFSTGGFAGLPPWLATVPSTVTFTFAAGATSATTTFRFQASGVAPVGTLSLVISASGGPPPPGIGTSSVNVQILQPSYTASASPNPVSIAWGGSRNVTVRTSVDPGYITSILYSFAGFPAGISWSTSQMVFSPYPPVTFTCSVAAGTAPGTYAGNLMASGLTNKTFPMSVTVQPPDITASFTQPSVTVCNGGPPVSDSISLQPAGGYVGTPTLSFQAVPAGLTMTPASPAASAMPPGQTVPFTVSASGASPGAQLVTLRIVDAGAVGAAGINKTIQLTVNVLDADFTPAVSPPSLSLVPGGGGVFIIAKSQGGYLSGKQDQQGSAQDPEEDRYSSQYRDGSRDTLCFVRTDCLGNLAHTTTVDAHPGNSKSKVGNRSIQTHQSEASRAQKQRHRLGTNDSNGDV